MAAPRALRRHDELQKYTLEQGLVLSDVPFVRWKAGRPKLDSKGPGIVVSEGCACEAYERALAEGNSNAAARVMLQVAPIRKAQVYGDKIETIKGGHVLGLFFIKGEGSRLGDCVADFSYQQAIPASVLADCTKSALISDWQWKRLLIHATVSQWRQKPEDLFREDLLESASDGA